MDAGGESIRISKEQKIFTDKLSGAVVQHRVCEVDRGVSWEVALMRYNAAKAAGAEAYFFKSKNPPFSFKQSAKERGVLLAVGRVHGASARGRSMWFSVQKPHTGFSPSDVHKEDLKDKNHVMDIDNVDKRNEMEKRWKAKYDDSKTRCAHAVCRARDPSLCGYGKRVKQHHLLTGCVLPIWRSLAEVSFIRDSDFKIVRMATDEGERIVGIILGEEDLAKLKSRIGVSGELQACSSKNTLLAPLLTKRTSFEATIATATRSPREDGAASSSSSKSSSTKRTAAQFAQARGASAAVFVDDDADELGPPRVATATTAATAAAGAKSACVSFAETGLWEEITLVGEAAFTAQTTALRDTVRVSAPRADQGGGAAASNSRAAGKRKLPQVTCAAAATLVAGTNTGAAADGGGGICSTGSVVWVKVGVASYWPGVVGSPLSPSSGCVRVNFCNESTFSDVKPHKLKCLTSSFIERFRKSKTAASTRRQPNLAGAIAVAVAAFRAHRPVSTAAVLGLTDDELAEVLATARDLGMGSPEPTEGAAVHARASEEAAQMMDGAMAAKQRSQKLAERLAREKEGATPSTSGSGSESDNDGDAEELRAQVREIMRKRADLKQKDLAEACGMRQSDFCSWLHSKKQSETKARDVQRKVRSWVRAQSKEGDQAIAADAVIAADDDIMFDAEQEHEQQEESDVCPMTTFMNQTSKAFRSNPRPRLAAPTSTAADDEKEEDDDDNDAAMHNASCGSSDNDATQAEDDHFEGMQAMHAMPPPAHLRHDTSAENADISMFDNDDDATQALALPTAMGESVNDAMPVETGHFEAVQAIPPPTKPQHYSSTDNADTSMFDDEDDATQALALPMAIGESERLARLDEPTQLDELSGAAGFGEQGEDKEQEQEQEQEQDEDEEEQEEEDGGGHRSSDEVDIDSETDDDLDMLPQDCFSQQEHEQLAKVAEEANRVMESQALAMTEEQEAAAPPVESDIAPPRKFFLCQTNGPNMVFPKFELPSQVHMAYQVVTIGRAPAGSAPAPAPAVVLRSLLGGRHTAATVHADQLVDGAALGRESIKGHNALVSKNHLKFRLVEGRVMLTDTSTNGTWVDGERLNKGVPVAVRDGQLLTLGGPDSRVASPESALQPLDFTLQLSGEMALSASAATIKRVAHIGLHDPTLQTSRQHCTLHYSAVSDSYFVEDQGSTNGVFLDRMKIARNVRIPCAVGCELAIGGQKPELAAGSRLPRLDEHVFAFKLTRQL